MDTNMLQYQNQKLASQLEVQRKDISDLEEKVEKLKAKQIRYDDTLGCVTRIWKQLNDDLQLLVSHAGGDIKPLPLLKTDQAEQGEADAAEDPFLARLLQTVGGKHTPTPPAAMKEDDDEDEADPDTLIDPALTACATTTKGFLAGVLQAIADERQRSDKVAETLTASLDEAARTQVEALQKENTQHQEAAASLHVQHRAHIEECSVLREQSLKDKLKITGLTRDLDAAQADLEQVQRKLASLRAGATGPPTTPMAGKTAAASSTPSKTPTSTDSKPQVTNQQAQMQIDELEAEKGDLVKTIARRDAEIAELEQAKHEATAAAVEARNHLQDEAHVRSSRPFQLLQTQYANMQNELQEYRQLVQQLSRERDIALMRERQHQSKAEQGETAMRSCEQAEARNVEAQECLRRVTMERDAALVQLRAEEHKGKHKGEAQTLEEMRAWSEGVQKQMKLLKDELETHRKNTCELTEARTVKMDASISLEAQMGETEEWKKRHAAAVEAESSKAGECEELLKRELELQLFVEVITQACPTPAPTLAQAIAKQKQAEQELDRLKANTLESSKEKLEEEKRAVQERIEEIEAARASLRANLAATQKAFQEAQETIKGTKAEHEGYIAEIEAIGGVLDDTQNQNKRLLEQLKERDEYASRMVQERLAAVQSISTMKEERDQASKQVQGAAAQAEAAKERALQLQAQVEQVLAELTKAVEDTHVYNAALEEHKKKIADQAQEVQDSRTVAGEAQAALAEVRRSAGEEAAEVERERSKRRRAEEDAELARSKVHRLQVANASGTGSQEIMEELKMYKDLLKCQVCHDRRKEVVISKCFHLFCRPCITKNLEMRHRKCPACGNAFGQADVHAVYL